MFTVNRSSLRDSSVRRDYQFSTNHNKSYLTPTTSSGNDSSANPDDNLDPNLDANVSVDDADDTPDGVDANESFDNLDPGLYSTSDVDSPNPTTQSEGLSIDPSDSVSQTLPLTRPRPHISSRSWVYEHFSVVVLEGKQYTPRFTSKLQTDKRRCCKYCDYKVLDSKRHGTSGLSIHLSKHGITKNRVPQRTTSIAELVMKPPPSKKPKLSPEESIVHWIADTLLPFVSVEHPSFHQVIEAHGGTPSIRCGDTVKNHMMKKADSSYTNLRTELELNCSIIALTWDGWTSKQQNIPILAVIGHWISPDFVLQQAILEYRRLRGVHSGENMAEVVYEMLHNLNLKHKLLAVTGDSASNNSTLVEHLHKRLLDEFDDEHDDELGNLKPLMRFQGKKSYIRCLAHALNCITKDILADLKSGTMEDTKTDTIDPSNAGPVAKLRHVVVWVGRTSQRTEKWQQHSPQKIIQYDVDNRWNSTYNMIGDALRCKAAVIQIVKDYSNDLGSWGLDSTDWAFLTQLFDVLGPFHEYTKLVSEGRPTIGTVMGVYFELVEFFDKATRRDSELAQHDERIIKALQASKEKFEKYGQLIADTPIYYIASVLDPRIKCSIIQAEDKHADAKIKMVRDTLHKLYPMQQHHGTGQAVDLSTKSTLELRMLGKVHKDATPISEIDRYLDGPLVDWDGSDDPNWLLRWWKANSMQYPIMSQVARDYLPIPPAEVDCERLFCSSRDLLGLRRHTMTPETMKGVLLVRDQYRRSDI